MNLRLLIQSAGLIVGSGVGIVGKGEGWMMTCCVGWMMNVGSMRGAGSVGGMKGVAVGTGEQAGMKSNIKSTAGRIRLVESRTERSRSIVIIIKKKGDPLPSRPTGNLCFFV